MDLFSRSDLSGIAACYTQEAQLLVTHNEPIHGRDTIGKVLGTSAGITLDRCR